MQRYYIHEGNLERLQNKLKAIENKCKKYNASFTFNIIEAEAEYREVEDEETAGRHLVRFIPVEAEGTISHGDWSFVATLEHSAEGNVIRQFNTELTVPERYRDAECICEHCNTRRNRRDTYIIFNHESGEFKQVGKSCLMEYTRGLSAEDVARYISWFDFLIKGDGAGGTRGTTYYNTLEVVQYAIECVRHWGYHKSLSWDDEEYYSRDYRSTKERVIDYMRVNRGWMCRHDYKAIEKHREEMLEVGFNHDTEQNKEQAAEMIAWASKFDTETFGYMHNLKVISRKEYIEHRDLGILISIVASYYRHLNNIEETKKKEAEHQKVADASNYVGQEKERITRNLQSCEHIYTSESIYGSSYLYKMVDTEGNVLTWWSSSWIDLDGYKVTSVTGTVKAHEEYRGIKQTVLTRCKFTCEKIEEEKKAEEIDEASILAARKAADEAMDVFYAAIEGE